MILELFEKLTKIPRCSGNSDPFVAFITEFATSNGYDVFVDNAKNVLCKFADKTQKLALQAHYDMVCLDDDKIPQIINDGQYLKALDSTLGADNGIACAYMMYLMIEQKNLEFLFTSDEEIGLIGANNLEFEISSQFMLNLDSENDAEICIGCAGGVDIIAKFTSLCEVDLSDYEIFELSILQLPGGHSGVDIDKNIPNALFEMIKEISKLDAKIINIFGGERINSIPKNATAIIATKKQPISTDILKIKKLESLNGVKVFSDNFLDFFENFENGVLEFNQSLNVVETSINLAKIFEISFGFQVEFSARSMDNQKLENIKNRTINRLKNFEFMVESKGKYFSWKPTINAFTEDIKKIFQQNNFGVEYKAIHAGLECAVVNAKYPNILIASIGPNIHNPHSNSEKVEISSIFKIYKILEKIVEKYE